jgi:hypothetical protein
MMYRVVSVGAAVFALTLFVCGAALAQQSATKANPNTHEGTVVSGADGKLVVKGTDGKEHTHNVAPDAVITSDGKAVKLNQLKVGERVRVTLNNGTNTVTRIEAIDQNKSFTAPNPK